VKLVFIAFNPKSYGCATDNTFMAESDTKERDKLASEQYAGLKDLKLPVSDAGYVRDAMARFDQVGFDDRRHSITKRRISQASKNPEESVGGFEEGRSFKNPKD
jgi:hypothetical protein